MRLKKTSWLRLPARLFYVVAGFLLLLEAVLVFVGQTGHLFGLRADWLVGLREIVEISTALIAALVLAETWYQRGHIRIDLVREHVPTKVRKIIDMVADVGGLVFVAAVTAGTYRIFEFQAMIGGKTDALRFPMAPPLLIFCILTGFFALVILVDLMQEFGSSGNS